MYYVKSYTLGAFLMVQWSRLWAPNAGGMVLSPSQGTKIPHATTKTQHSQVRFLKRVTCKY